MVIFRHTDHVPSGDSYAQDPITEHQIIAVLMSIEAGRTVKDVCREAAISEASYYNSKKKHGGIEAADIKKIKNLEDENRRLN